VRINAFERREVVTGAWQTAVPLKKQKNCCASDTEKALNRLKVGRAPVATDQWQTPAAQPKRPNANPLEVSYSDYMVLKIYWDDTDRPSAGSSPAAVGNPNFIILAVRTSPPFARNQPTI
jgi:hypothetical protein